MSSTIPRDYDFTFKILILGDSGVGKTCLIKRFTDNDFTDNFLSTIGIDSKSKIVPVDGVRTRLQIWDTAGQERFRTLTSAYFRGAMGIMLVYDVTNEESFLNVSHWLENIEFNANSDVCKFLVGNKSDSQMDERAVTDKKGQDRATQIDLPFIETSAKTGKNVEKAFSELALLIKKQKDIKDKINAHKNLSPFSDKTNLDDRTKSNESCC
eukprot:gene6522-7266_t